MFNILKKKFPRSFDFLPAKEVLMHDRLLQRTVLRFVPLSFSPNAMTSIRVVMTPIVFFITYVGYIRSGILLFAVAAFTDMLDGSMARSRNQITRFGMLYDPLADKLLIGSMVILLVFQHLNPLLGLLIIVLEVVIVISALTARIRYKQNVAANKWGKIKMMLQVIAMCLTMVGLLVGFPYLLHVATWVFGVAVGFACLSLFTRAI